MISWFVASFPFFFFFFFFTDTATTEIYTLSLHDALPIPARRPSTRTTNGSEVPARARRATARDRKSTRLNSSHSSISYAVFCLKKKNKTPPHPTPSRPTYSTTTTTHDTPHTHSHSPQSRN